MINVNNTDWIDFNSNVKVIAFYENKWMEKNTDYAQWSHLCRSFGAQLQLIYNWTEAIIPEGYSVIILEEAADKYIKEFIHPDKCVYIMGKTGMNNIQKLIDYDDMVKIPQIDEVCLFGISAASIILYDRLIKWQ